MPEQIQGIIANLKSFGVRRLALMGGIAALVMAVIGIASEAWGESPFAVVVRAPGAEPSEPELIEFARERLAHY